MSIGAEIIEAVKELPETATRDRLIVVMVVVAASALLPHTVTRSE